MLLCTVNEAVTTVLAGILIAICTKRADGVTYGNLLRPLNLYIGIRMRGKARDRKKLSLAFCVTPL